MIAMVSFSFPRNVGYQLSSFFPTPKEGLKPQALIFSTASHPGRHFPGRLEVYMSLLSTLSAFAWTRTALWSVPLLGAAGSDSPDCIFCSLSGNFQIWALIRNIFPLSTGKWANSLYLKWWDAVLLLGGLKGRAGWWKAESWCRRPGHPSQVVKRVSDKLRTAQG